jgi:hypothetical protein
MQVFTIQVFVNHINNNWAPKPINRCIAFIPNALQLFEMIFHALVIKALIIKFGLKNPA